MTNPVLADVLADARNPGPICGPKELLAALADVDRPLELLNNWDNCNNLCDKFDNDYNFIRLCGAAGVRPSDSDMLRWSSLLRWMLEELANWNPVGDPNLRTLAAIFVTGTMSDIDHKLWRLLPNAFSANAHLVKTMQTLLGQCKAAIDVPLRTRAPISTKDAIAGFTEANAAKDWKALDEYLHSFGDYILPSLPQTQATRILARCGNAELLEVISGLDDALLAAAFVAAIADEDMYLPLAVSCSSSHFEFAALRRAVSRRVPQAQSITPLLAPLLVKISADTTRWRALMDVFNQYPIRYPALQESLGVALAGSSSKAMEAYVSAIQLNSVAINDAEREDVAVCLRAFRASASGDKREELWRFAYERWSAWDFERSNSEAHLFEVRASLLDYAIVGYAIECLGINATGMQRY